MTKHKRANGFLTADEHLKLNNCAPERMNFSASKGRQGRFDIWSIQMPLWLLSEFFEADDEADPRWRSQRLISESRGKKVTSYIAGNSSDYVIPSLTATICDDIPDLGKHPSAMVHSDDFTTCDYNQEPDYRLSGKDIYGQMTVLSIPKTSRFFFLDGQHRATGIKGLKQTAAMAGVTLDQMFPDDTVIVMLRMDTGLSDRQAQFSVINSTAAKTNGSLNALYEKKQAASGAAALIIRQLFVVGNECGSAPKWRIDYEKTACSGRNSNTFAFKTLMDTSLQLLGVSADEDVSASEEAYLKIMWQCYLGIEENWFRYRNLNASELREASILPHSVFIAGFAAFCQQVKKQHNGDIEGFKAAIESATRGLSYQKDAQIWQQACFVRGALSKRRNNIDAVADVFLENAMSGIAHTQYA